ncbi:MAG: glycosyltransferase [Candidatus Thiodiazotropha weberae]|uniref:Beta-monoglucosyldiacylglycerol synthase n=1 Tax=Candidatus Thiodiazotropha endoloripes TaxID=1818881 RepID=A0A1E2UU81_9GAMM|nr:glycosyltransferase [Candidatus Thiodiazotropha endoloripes]MCG7900397.1 glycosyltransferase [Candidatus Thiodiazotropha weberae]ODB86939.1 beta-(1-3)-glucosyl transferase [Candidatus Thiodiazotropha endoloripes]ODB88966.1 beta-(1-3)-glucosyl transferase [Candidatus Thiodiazotropha endoloripes]ODB98105.1 beta-(1-3)-glucosyl transferase [Candidatus Thiodiazotropha endoloripes]
MLRPNLVITLVIALLTLMIWNLLGGSSSEPPWPKRIQGFSFSPVRAWHDPSLGRYPSEAEIEADLLLLSDKTYAVRSYSVSGSYQAIPGLAEKHGLNVALGAWIDGDPATNSEEIETLISLSRQHHKNVVRVMVGNEALYRGDITLQQAIENLTLVKQRVWAPVSLAEPWHIWLEHPQLAEHVDYIAAHILPYWEGQSVDAAVDFTVSAFEKLQQTFPDKPIVIAEVGWPSNGRPRREATPSQANQASFLRRFLQVAEERSFIYYVMEAFDQPWKERQESGVGTYWGVYDIDRNAKFTFSEPVVDVPHWRELAAISILFGVIALLFLFRDSEGLRSSGRGFLALVAYGAATGAVWMFYDYTRQYMTLNTVLVGIVLFIGMLGVLVVLFAEAHEWAESLWLRQWRRQPKRKLLKDDDLPMVSIHVPAYNEPPDMMIETLDALAKLDYPNYEVLVIDNNTKDPQVWKPVEAHCEKLGQRFRFFHRSPLAGFKAGALNLTLKKSHPNAQVIAVIDSDYQVEASWLRDLVPLFQRQETAIVQSPQDYRDGGESCFKAMCLAEYRGFFHIGMVTRNERNAIIQHGTMTMVRRSVLEEIGGWGEWCITEDADLGLRVFEQGHEAVYIPKSYGRGLMPDTFLDFKKQRFRWAYGAVQILKHHLGMLFATRTSQLTPGQRYHFIAGWLPWFADGFNLFFNIAAITWSACMLIWPVDFTAPLPLFAVLPMSLFVFKILKMFFLYRRRVEATVRQSIAAALAGLALSHTIALAIVQGIWTSGLPFFRTPKQANNSGLLKALQDAREEALFFLALLLAATAVNWQYGADSPDAQIWSIVLLLQAIPYGAAIVVSMISAFPGLSARIVGPMGVMPDTLEDQATEIESGLLLQNPDK